MPTEDAVPDVHAAPALRIAVIGDVHSAWEASDLEYFNQSTYDLLLVTGDLNGSQVRDALTVARSMARLTRSALIMPGNNDVEQYARIAAELTYRRGQADLLEELLPSGGEPEDRPRLCGYSTHGLAAQGLAVSIVTGRPFAMGGDQVSFPEALERSFGLRTMQDSARLLRELIDRTTTEHLVLFAHNGPQGLGQERDALWGRDFQQPAIDWGDSDLRAAVDHAQRSGRRLLAVVAGHMHWSLRGGGQRRWQLRKDGVLYVNAARVPRIVSRAGTRTRHHLVLELAPDAARVREVAVLDQRHAPV